MKKILKTIIIVCISLFIYILVMELGTQVQDSDICLFLAVMGWIWLLLGQFTVLELIWE